MPFGRVLRGVVPLPVPVPAAPTPGRDWAEFLAGLADMVGRFGTQSVLFYSKHLWWESLTSTVTLCALALVAVYVADLVYARNPIAGSFTRSAVAVALAFAIINGLRICACTAFSAPHHYLECGPW